MDILSSPWTTPHHRSSIGNHRWFAIGDVHGQDAVFEVALKTLSAITDTPFSLVLLGDLIDRGPNSLRCLELAEQAQDISGATSVVKLPGNHELMMLDFAHNRDEADIWLDNGGYETLESMKPRTGPIKTVPDIIKAIKTTTPAYWLNGDFPTHARIGDYVFVHGGISPHQDTASFLAKPAEKARLQAMDGEHWAWMRGHFLRYPGSWPNNQRLTVVHGHTPAYGSHIMSPPEFKKCLFPDGRRRVCLDGGATIIPQLLIGEFFENSVRVHTPCETSKSPVLVW